MNTKQENNKSLNCECDKIFNAKECDTGEALRHVEVIKNIFDMFNQFKETVTGYGDDYKYLVDHPVKVDKLKYLLYKNLNLIAYSSTYVINVIFKNTLNDINFNNTVVDGMYDTYLLTHTTQDKNMERFNGKKIVTCIISINSSEMEFYEFPLFRIIMLGIGFID